MAEMNVLDKNSKIDGDKVVVTKITEEHLRLQDLYQAKQNIQHQKQGIMQQIGQLKERLMMLENQDKENNEFINMLEEKV
jgi:hypothetical protein